MLVSFWSNVGERFALHLNPTLLRRNFFGRNRQLTVALRGIESLWRAKERKWKFYQALNPYEVTFGRSRVSRGGTACT